MLKRGAILGGNKRFSFLIRAETLHGGGADTPISSHFSTSIFFLFPSTQLPPRLLGPADITNDRTSKGEISDHSNEEVDATTARLVTLQLSEIR